MKRFDELSNEEMDELFTDVARAVDALLIEQVEGTVGFIAVIGNSGYRGAISNLDVEMNELPRLLRGAADELELSMRDDNLGGSFSDN